MEIDGAVDMKWMPYHGGIRRKKVADSDFR